MSFMCLTQHYKSDQILVTNFTYVRHLTVCSGLGHSQKDINPNRFVLPTALGRWSWVGSYFVWLCGFCYAAFHAESCFAPCSPILQSYLAFVFASLGWWWGQCRNWETVSEYTPI